MKGMGLYMFPAEIMTELEAPAEEEDLLNIIICGGSGQEQSYQGSRS